MKGLSYLGSIFCVLLLVACYGNNDEILLEDERHMQTTSILRFEGGIERFDANTRASVIPWEDDAKVYIQFLGNSQVSGYATYKKSSDVWTLYLDGVLTQGQTSTCEVYYFENPVSSSSSSVNLSAKSSVYADKGATYLYKSGVVTLQGHLKPQTGRVRFKGTAGYTFMLKGLKWYSSYNATSGSLSQDNGQMEITIGSDGYTPYVYATYDNSSTRQLTVSNDSQGTYDKSFSSSVLAAGKSGYINVPTLDNHYGWTFNPNPIAENVEAIDLGLTSGTLWANKNLGSANSGEYGDFYAWGETETKSTYLLSNYSHYNADYQTFDSPYKGVKGIQGSEQDAAHVIWGGNWVIPTPTQFSELVEQCTWEWQTDYNSTGVKGYLVESKKNSNYIFLPITGYYNGASRTAQNRGFYWTSSLYLFPADWDKAKQAMEFVIEQSDNENDMHYQMDTSRACGLAIRPVKNN